MGISAIREKSNQFVANLDVFIAEALNDQDQSFIDINIEQMQDSKRADDATITPKYSPGYALFKGFTNPNLKLTGSFHRLMEFITDGKMFYHTSQDPKTTDLIDKYSSKIFGIPPSKQEKAQGIALSSLARIYNKFVLNG